MLVVAVRDKSSHQEVHENNQLMKRLILHILLEASKGPKA